MRSQNIAGRGTQRRQMVVTVLPAVVRASNASLWWCGWCLKLWYELDCCSVANLHITFFHFLIISRSSHPPLISNIHSIGNMARPATTAPSWQ